MLLHTPDKLSETRCGLFHSSFKTKGGEKNTQVLFFFYKKKTRVVDASQIFNQQFVLACSSRREAQ